MIDLYVKNIRDNEGYHRNDILAVSCFQSILMHYCTRYNACFVLVSHHDPNQIHANSATLLLIQLA